MLAEKLKLKPDQKVRVLNPPPEFDLSVLPLGARGTDAVLAFVSSAAEVRRWGAAAIEAAGEQQSLWMAYPKKSSGHDVDITRDHGWDALTDAGFEPVAQIAIDEVWSALRFRAAVKVKRRAPAPGHAVAISRTLPVSVRDAWAAWEDPDKFTSGLQLARSTPGKSMRFSKGGESVEVRLYDKGMGRCLVTVDHSKLASEEAAARAKAWWNEALDRLKTICEVSGRI